MRRAWILACATGLAFGWSADSARSQVANDATFIYQGQLTDSGAPADGFYDFMFRLFDGPDGGDPIPIGDIPSLVLPHQDVQHGLFSVPLDFGSAVFLAHDELWLEIAVKPAEFTPAAYTTLAPRQRIDASPRSIVARYAERTAGTSLTFGNLAHTSIGIDPDLTGLTAMDPVGMRVMSMKSPGRCSISDEPCMLDQHCSQGQTCDPCETCDPLPTQSGSLYLGPQKNRIGISENVSGIIVNNVVGLRLVAGAHVCSEEYPNYPQVRYCETSDECYGCCTPMKHCSVSGAQCDTDGDCQTGHCAASGNDCNSVWDCAPGRCTYSLSPCFVDNCVGPGSDSCTSPRPEGCVGGETCNEDRPCTQHCQSDADCLDEGAFCSFPVPSDCISPDGRCSGNGYACYADTDCPPGHCADRPDRECWENSDCLICNWGCADVGPCVGAETCQEPVRGHLGQAIAVRFGETNDHGFGFDPGLQRLVAIDPGGLSLVSPGKVCSGGGTACETDEDCLPGGCSNSGYACLTDADCYGASAETCTNPPPQTCESDVNGLRVFFGPGGDTSVGTQPDMPGLVLQSQEGARVVAPSPPGGAPASAKLHFGASMVAPYIGDDPVEGGLVIGAARGVVLFDPQPKPPRSLRLIFGLDDEFSIGTDPALAGLVLRSANGVRLTAPRGAAARLNFGDSLAGPFLGDDPADGGLVIGASRGIVLFDPQPKPPRSLRLVFGLEDETSIGTDPDVAGLILRHAGGIRLLNSVNPMENALIFGLGGILAREPRIDTGATGDQLRLSAAGFSFSGGPVGIGTATPRSALDVESELPVGLGAAVAGFNRVGSDGVILDFRTNGASVGTISVSHGIVSYNSFTGSHLAWSDSDFAAGDLVRLTGENSRLREESESEIVYGIALSTDANDPRCLGAYLAEYASNESNGNHGIHLVMASGNGELWVADNGFDVAPGDYLISSGTPGCAMRDDWRRFPVGYVVARAAEGVHWADVIPDRHGVRKAKISVFFESFARSGNASHLVAEVARLTDVIDAQRRTLEALERRLTTRLDSMEDRSRQEEVKGTPSGSGDFVPPDRK